MGLRVWLVLAVAVHACGVGCTITPGDERVSDLGSRGDVEVLGGLDGTDGRDWADGQMVLTRVPTDQAEAHCARDPEQWVMDPRSEGVDDRRGCLVLGAPKNGRTLIAAVAPTEPLSQALERRRRDGDALLARGEVGASQEAIVALAFFIPPAAVAAFEAAAWVTAVVVGGIVLIVGVTESDLLDDAFHRSLDAVAEPAWEPLAGAIHQFAEDDGGERAESYRPTRALLLDQYDTKSKCYLPFVQFLNWAVFGKSRTDAVAGYDVVPAAVCFDDEQGIIHTSPICIVAESDLVLEVHFHNVGADEVQMRSFDGAVMQSIPPGDFGYAQIDALPLPDRIAPGKEFVDGSFVLSHRLGARTELPVLMFPEGGSLGATPARSLMRSQLLSLCGNPELGTDLDSFTVRPLE